MKDENFFEDLVEGFRPKAKNIGQDQIHIPKGCFSCGGRSFATHGCLEMNCQIYSFLAVGISED